MADVDYRTSQEAKRLRDGLPSKQRGALDAAFAHVGERIAGDERLRVAVREACWFLQESWHQEILGNLRYHDDPVQARTQEMFLRGLARGIEFACDHMTDGDHIRTVREWIAEATKTGDMA